MSHPRVLLVTPDFPPATGGIQRLLGGLVAHAGWETLVVTLDQRDPANLTLPALVSRAFKALFRQLRISRLNVATIRRGLAWRPDAIVSGHIITSPAALALGELLRVPTVQYVHAKEIACRPRLGRFALARSSATIAHSEHGAAIAREAGVDPKRLHVIPPGVDMPDMSAAAAKAEVPTILTVARLVDRYKGFDVMLRAMPLVRARVPRARWVVVGEGPLRGELERSAQAAALDDAVVFRGHVSDEELDLWYRRSHVFVMLSRLPADGGGEGYGLVYLEAGAHGLPCVAGNAGAVAEAVIDGVTGLLVTATDHAEAAGALTALLDDPDRAAALGAAAYARARSLSWQRMGATVEALVADLIASTR